MFDRHSRFMRSSLSRRRVLAGGAGAAAGLRLLSSPLARTAFAQDASIVNLASNAGDPEPRRRLALQIENFNGMQDDYNVEINTTAHEDFKQAIRTYLVSDNPPDVLTWFAGNRMRFFSNNGLLMPLDDLFEENGWDDAYPEGIRAVSKGSDGKYYFVPVSYYAWAVWYRPSMFQELGLEPPTTWDDFLKVIDTVKDAGKVPITIGTQMPWTAAAWFDYLNMRVNGPEFHISLMDGNESYASEAVKNAFGRWRELLDREAFIPQPEAYAWQDAVRPLVQGDAAMYLMGRFIYDEFPDDQQDDLDFFRFPIIDEGVGIGEDAPSDGYFASANASNPDGARALLSYFGSAESQTLNVEEGGDPGVHPDVSLDLYDEVTRRTVEMLQDSDYIAQFYDRDTHPDLAERGMSAFVEFWNNPDDLDGILERLDEERKRVYEQDA